MRVNGKTIKLMGLVHILIRMVRVIEANGITILSKVKDLKLGQMELNILDHTFKERNKAMEDSYGQKDQALKETL